MSKEEENVDPMDTNENSVSAPHRIDSFSIDAYDIGSLVGSVTSHSWLETYAIVQGLFGSWRQMLLMH